MGSPDDSTVGFKDQVAKAFSRHIDEGKLAIESSVDDPEAFGNAASGLEPGQWHPLQRVIRAAGGASQPAEGLLSPADAARLVERYFPDLSRAMAGAAWDRTRENLAKLEQEALAAVKDRLGIPR